MKKNSFQMRSFIATAFLILFVFMQGEFSAQGSHADSIIRICSNPQYSLQDKLNYINGYGSGLHLSDEESDLIFDTVNAYLEQGSDEDRKLLALLEYLKERYISFNSDESIDKARTDSIMQYLYSNGAYEILASLLHMDLYDLEARKMFPEYLEALKKSFRLYLEKVKDTSMATHMLGHYFSYHDAQYSQAEVDTLFYFLNIVMDHFRRSQYLWGLFDSKEYLYSQLFFLYNDWGEVNEALALADELLEHGVVPDDSTVAKYARKVQYLVYDGRLTALEWSDLKGFAYGSRGNWQKWDSIIHANSGTYKHIVETADSNKLLPRFQMVPDDYYQRVIPVDTLLAFMAYKYIEMVNFNMWGQASTIKELYPWVLLIRIGNTMLEEKNRALLLRGHFDPLLTSLGFSNLDELYQAAEKGIEKSVYHLQVLQTHILYPDWIKYHKILGHDKTVIDLQDQLNGLMMQDKMSFRSRLMSSIQSYYEIQQKESEIALLNAENTQARQWQIFLLVGGALALLIIIGLINRMNFMRKTQRELSVAREKAMQSEKAKQQFLANMSHEIRTPMNAIMGMTDILLRRDPKRDQLTYLNAIRESSNSLLVIINDILDLSKIEAGKVEFEEISFSMENVLGNLKTIINLRAVEKGLEFKILKSPDLPDKLQGDPTRLYQVLVNLAGNAIKFTEKGKVTVKAELAAREEANRVRIRFVVEDTGIGMDPDHMEKIFRSFEQAYSDTSRKYGGTGLGLTISKQLVEMQGGQIRVESEKGIGSRFTFELSFKAENEYTEIASGTAKAEPILHHHLTGTRILLVEDNEFNIMVAREALEDSIKDVAVTVAKNGEEALKMISDFDFDLVLMDLQMPVMNGFDATRSIRSMHSDKAKIPIIAMTANVMKEEVDRCKEVGMNEYISKPFDINLLLAKIQELTAKK